MHVFDYIINIFIIEYNHRLKGEERVVIKLAENLQYEGESGERRKDEETEV